MENMEQHTLREDTDDLLNENNRFSAREQTA